MVFQSIWCRIEKNCQRLKLEEKTDRRLTLLSEMTHVVMVVFSMPGFAFGSPGVFDSSAGHIFAIKPKFPRPATFLAHQI